VGAGAGEPSGDIEDEVYIHTYVCIRMFIDDSDDDDDKGKGVASPSPPPAKKAKYDGKGKGVASPSPTPGGGKHTRFPDSDDDE
jgi:hypothetical protein